MLRYDFVGNVGTKREVKALMLVTLVGTGAPKDNADSCSCSLSPVIGTLFSGKLIEVASNDNCVSKIHSNFHEEVYHKSTVHGQ